MGGGLAEMVLVAGGVVGAIAVPVSGTFWQATQPVSILPVVPTALTGTEDTIGATAIVAAPSAGTRIVVVVLVMQNEAATAKTITLHIGAATVGFRALEAIVAYKNCASSDGTTPAYRPMLTVDYTLPMGRALHGLLNRSIL